MTLHTRAFCDYLIEEVRPLGARLDDSVAQRISYAAVVVLVGWRMTAAHTQLSLFPGR